MSPHSIPENAVPNNLEAERALLGSILLDNDALTLVLQSISKEDFFSEAHRLTFEEMLSLREHRRAIDLVTLSEGLSRRGLVQKAGGAAYIAALTDGVPIGSPAAVTEYCTIVRNKSLLRKVINSAQNIIARAQEGQEDADSILELAGSQITEITESQKAREALAAPAPKPEQKSARRYPVVPAEAWHPAALVYRRAVEQSTEASDNWHFASFYTVVGTLLGRSVMTRMGKYIYPNLYIVLVGLVGGDGKDTAIDFAVNELLPRVRQEVHAPRSIQSREGFIKAWDAFLRKPRGALEAQNFNGVNRAILRMAEFRDVIDKINYTGTQSIATLINECYDGPPDLPRQTAQDNFSIDHPHLSAVFGTALDYMKQLQERDITSGVGRRLLIIPGDPKEPIPDPEAPDSEVLDAVADLIGRVLAFWASAENHCLPLSEGARKLWCAWYKSYKARVYEGDIIGAMTIGDRTNLRKIALINAALDREQEISELNLQRALAFGEFLFESRWPIFSEHGANPNVQIENKLVAKVASQLGRRIRKRILQKAFPRIDAETFNRRLDFLCKADGRLTLRQEGRMWWVIAPEGA